MNEKHYIRHKIHPLDACKILTEVINYLNTINFIETLDIKIIINREN